MIGQANMGGMSGLLGSMSGMPVGSMPQGMPNFMMPQGMMPQQFIPQRMMQMFPQMFMQGRTPAPPVMPNVRTAADIFQAPRPMPPRPDVMPTITPTGPSRVVDYDRRVPPPRPSRIM